MNNCGCNNESSTFKCDKFGTFIANDVNCINPSITADGSIIPFSSGNTLSIVDIIADVKTASLIGFSSAINDVVIIGNTRDLTGFFIEAFTVPREGKITAISATFSLITGQVSDGTATIRAQIFLAPEGSNIFTGTSASIDLAPPLTGTVLGEISYASANISPVPVSPGDQLLMLFYISSKTGNSVIYVLRGNASAGIKIV
ncbi:exosporium glycoprotein BclB-related protein [Lysinibacillus xylanilyticus]|uniref:exosporium glycoprotein BclB-related protein n=1 Tax=Lysinibacillus xylanilyticus TaxID=582475 RepID=UPI0036DC1A56